MTEKPTKPEVNGETEEGRPAVPKDTGPTVPKPSERSTDVDRKIRAAVEKMFEDVQNPYETVIVAAQEARRINDHRLKVRSILNQAVEHVEELVPEVPFVPRPVEDEEPEVKATNVAIEKLACGLVPYEVEGKRSKLHSYYDGEIDFPIYPDEAEGSAEEGAPEGS